MHLFLRGEMEFLDVFLRIKLNKTLDFIVLREKLKYVHFVFQDLTFCTMLNILDLNVMQSHNGTD